MAVTGWISEACSREMSRRSGCCSMDDNADSQWRQSLNFMILLSVVIQDGLLRKGRGILVRFSCRQSIVIMIFSLGVSICWFRYRVIDELSGLMMEAMQEQQGSASNALLVCLDMQSAEMCFNGT